MINDPKTALIGNPVTGKPSFVFIYGYEADGCTISGEGTIDANGHAFVERKDMEYSYNDGDLYYFMDPESYELVPIGADVLGDSFKFVQENMTCTVKSYKGKVFAVEPPNFVDLVITATEPGFKGDTATGTTKPATLETGAVIKVPLFIDNGTVIRIDTRTGEYLERA